MSVTEEPDTLDSAQALLIRGFPADVLADEFAASRWTVGGRLDVARGTNTCCQEMRNRSRRPQG